MSLGDFLKNLVLDTWYKALVYVGGLILLLSLFIEVKGIANQQLQLLSTGIFFFGLGEWKNHKKESFIKPPNVYTGPTALISYTVWKPDLLGILFDLIGITLIGFGIWFIIK
jgi:hypothetical protein